MSFIVAIDGPAGVGKTTLARRSADLLGIAYLDTGAMFRCLALKLGRGADSLPEEDLRERASQMHFQLEGSGQETRLLCQGVVIGQEIRTEEVALLASRIARVPVIREILKEIQRSIAENTPLVAEGRDIGTVVFPNAPFKFFLDARPEVRAQRRQKDLLEQGKEVDLQALIQQIRERDDLDRNRAVAPLVPAADAILLDSSDCDADEMLGKIVSHIRAKEGICDLAACFRQTQLKKPLVHFITNYVTVNDCANITLAAGASPIMADDPEEVAEITSLCQALVLNMGTPCDRTVKAMLLAGQKANSLGHPVVFDPVGVGASAYRKKIALDLLAQVHMDVIKGNISEIKFLASGVGATKGVDALDGELVQKSTLAPSIELAQGLAKKTGAIIIISGALDIVASADKVAVLWGGDPKMGRVSGTGCMAAGLLASYLGAGKGFDASLTAMSVMKTAGKFAATERGNASYKIALIDAVSEMNEKKLLAYAQFKLI